MPEIMSGGAALFDKDGDGDLDAYLVQSGALKDPPEKRPPNQLFENSGSGTFTDVTEASGAGDRGIGMGVACGDTDGDGDVDLFVANLGLDVLLSNTGDGHFTDVTARAGVGAPAWSSSAAFFDADLDGDLDLWVCHYLNWIPAAEHACMNHSGARDYCNPTAYQAPALDSFFRNRGDGSYDDATRSAGIDRAATGLGVVCLDADEDGWLDVYVANDQMPNQLWHNQGGVRFVETGLQDGCAVDYDGAAKAGMGIAASDVDDDGDTDMLVCNLENESDSLFENKGGYFVDRSAAANLRAVSRTFTRFGVGWQDFNSDGLLDLYVADGRVMRLHPPLADDPYAEPNILLRGLPGGRYEEVLPRGGTAAPLVATSRAAAFGDVDGDGAVDVLVVNRDGPAHLLMNRAPSRGHWLTLRLLDEHGDDALHARLTAYVGDKRFSREVRTAYSYQSSSTPFIHLGLGEATRVDRVEVRWPDGAVEEFGPYEADRTVKLVRSAPLARAAAAGPDTRAEFEEVAERLRTGRNEYFGRAQVDALLARRRASGLAPAERANEAVLLTGELLRLGEVDEALSTIEDTLHEVAADPALAPLEVAVQHARGLAWLRKAEREKGEEREPAEKALESYLFLAQRDPKDLEARWLLNVAAMTLGEWPDGVPEEHRIPPSALASEIDIGRFHDVAPRLGLDVVGLAGGVVVDDLDGDGLLDVLTSSLGSVRRRCTCSCGDADGTFEDASARVRARRRSSAGSTAWRADYDNDGDVDVLVLRGAWLGEDGRVRNSLLRNAGDGLFEDVTHAAGLPRRRGPPRPRPWPTRRRRRPRPLRRQRVDARDDAGQRRLSLAALPNDGHGHFTDVAAERRRHERSLREGRRAGRLRQRRRPRSLRLERRAPTGCTATTATATLRGRRRRAGVTEPVERSFATWFFDYDNDGWLDLFVAGYDATARGRRGGHTSACRTRRRSRGCTTTRRRHASRDVAAEAGLERALLADGRELRRPRQRRLARHLPRDRGSRATTR